MTCCLDKLCLIDERESQINSRTVCQSNEICGHFESKNISLFDKHFTKAKDENNNVNVVKKCG